MATLLDGIACFIISKSNLELLLKYYTFDDYTRFYEENLLAIPEPEIDGYTLDEPLEEKPEDSNKNSEDSNSKNKSDDNRSLQTI